MFEMHKNAEKCNYDLSQSEFKPTSHPESEQFMFETVDCEEIREIVSSMPTNKSPGIDQISMRVIKDIVFPQSYQQSLPLLTPHLFPEFFPAIGKWLLSHPFQKMATTSKQTTTDPSRFCQFYLRYARGRCITK
jgi:hypothetical protein